MESSKDPKKGGDKKEGRDNAPFVGLGITLGAGLGVVLGVVLFAITQNPVWIAIVPGLGIVVGAVLQANRQ